MKPSENLLKIPAYYYHPEPKLPIYNKAAWFEKLLRTVWQTFDLDITLPIFLEHLLRVHKGFYNDFTAKPDFLKDSKFYIRKLKSEVFRIDKMVSFEALIPTEVDLSAAFEG